MKIIFFSTYSSSSFHCNSAVFFRTSVYHVKLYSKIVICIFYTQLSDTSFWLRKWVNYMNQHGTLSKVVFWVVMPCSVIGGYQYFGGMYCCHLLGEIFPLVLFYRKCKRAIMKQMHSVHIVCFSVCNTSILLQKNSCLRKLTTIHGEHQLTSTLNE
jgi:hypothetical protein